MYSRQAVKIKPLTQALEVRDQIILKIIRTSRRAIYDCVINVEIFRSCWCKEADHSQNVGREVDHARTLPWGTSTGTGFEDEIWLDRAVTWLLLDKYDLNQFTHSSERPTVIRF